MDTGYLRAPHIRGIRVPHRKNTDGMPTRPLLSPARVTLPMAQHIGKPAKPVVKKGDKVAVGTLVGEADGFVSANVHSSVSGTVADICTIMATSGAEVEAVVIDSDGEFKPVKHKAPKAETAADLVQAIAQSGLVGLGGAGFPTHVKFQLPEDARVDTLVINAAECEPYITSDDREMLENADGVIEGVRRVRQLLALPHAVIGIESNKPEAAAKLAELARPHDIEVRTLKTSYPQGAEKVLIANLTGRAVPAGGLPADAGVVIVNVSTVAFVAAYLETGMPLVRRRVTVDGDAIQNPGNLWVPIGTTVSDIIEACGGYAKPPAKLVLGGPMMGIALFSGDVPLCKANNGVLALSHDELTLTADNNCIRCGRCNDSCPVLLSPAEIQVAQAGGDAEGCQKMYAMDCIECGNCTYVCPARRPVTQYMRLAKADIRKAVAKNG